jgi:ATP-binding cassette subfamily B protein
MIPMIAATLGFRKLARKVTRQGSRAMAAVNDNIQETVTGISVAKNFRQEAMIYEEFERINQQSYRINMRRGMVLATVFPVLNALAGFATGAVVYIGARAALGGTISVSVWYLYIQSVDHFWFPAINIASYWNQFQQAMIDTENTVQQVDNQPAGKLSGLIEFDDVIFEYRTGERVLDHFNLTIQPGESVAFVGHTGAGKSTIAKLIMRLYEFQGGSIRADGQDIRSFDLHSYRCQLGFVPQMPFLFSGTIADNIRYGRPGATDEEIEHFAFSIGSGEWLETLPNGLQSDVGERGAHLSIGQRQLVSLLRVLVQEPAVFILDEATASIDSFTELQIQEALEMILAQSTSILIAHRLSTVRSADRIIVLREGTIIEEGSHTGLMSQDGHYAELYNTYFRHQSLSYVENARGLLGNEEAAR